MNIPARRDPTPDDDAILSRARGRHDQLVREAQLAVKAFVEACAPEHAASFLTNLEAFFPHLDELCREDPFTDPRVRNAVAADVMFLLGEYVCQRFGGLWLLDDVPFSPSFARTVIEVPAVASGAIRVDVARLATDYIGSPPPRTLYAQLRPLMMSLSGRA